MDIKPPAEDPIVIIGNGMAGWRLCQQLVERGVNQKRRIIIFGEEPRPAYDRVNLTKAFYLDDPDELLLAKAEWYESNGIERRPTRHIISIDRQAKTLHDNQGDLTAYGDCILATGSRPFIPNAEGVKSPKVFVYRTLQDIQSIKAVAKKGQSCLVIGGGLLGLEAADTMRRMGLETCIVHSANCLMSRQLTPDSSSYLLREVAQRGISVRLITRTKEIQPTEGRLRVSFDQGEPMDVDLVVLAAGIRPRDELAVQAGLAVGVRGGGVIIDDALATADPNIFAIGECVSHHGVIYGIVAPAYQQADVLAARLAGKKEFYRGSDHSCRLKLLGIEVSVFGDFMGEGTTHVYRSENCYRALVTRLGHIVGATIVGPWDKAMLVERAVREKRSISQRVAEAFVRDGEIFNDPAESSVLNWPDSALICHCTNTNCGSLRKAVAGGCSTVKALGAETGAGRVCGSCLPQLAEFVGEDAQALAAAGAPRGKWLLIISAVLGLVLALTIFCAPGLPAAQSVQGSYYQLTQIWTDSLTKQITGYSLAGVSAIALLLSARKRIKFLSFGNYGFWRAAHSWLGVTTIAILFFHTGMHLGENLNLWLMICFLGLNLAGALAAIAVAAEKRIDGYLGMRMRRWALKSHLLFFAPYPILLGFHIAKVYIY
ncbi:FAD-dependent oxidoreductase [Cerasicoccus maritimus]|uniref:FAD-dependent oxidoreductase n=1 Tax=Cerasicoccus maritimus TaxID=490089 RepID=UPI00285262B3|nr:FAD-dependent oxidoreductase [Cerasicoccus maritimus]